MTNPNLHLFRHCPACGACELDPSGPKSFTCGACSFKFYINTAAAGIALIMNDREQLLVTRRKNDPAAGTLDLPGGFAEPGETMEECLIREVKEELNLDIGEPTYFCSFPNTYLYRDVLYSVLDTAFWCPASDFSGIRAADDVSDYEFIDLDRLDIGGFGLDSPKRVIKKILQSDPIR